MNYYSKQIYSQKPGVSEKSGKLLPEPNIEDRSLSEEAVDQRSGVFIAFFITRSSFYSPYDDSSRWEKPFFTNPGIVDV